MPLALWFAFVAASAFILVIPGPTVLTVISYSAANGRRAGLPIVAGVALGDATSLAVSLLGLGALLAASAFWFTVVKWVGGLYLIALGIKLFRAGATPSAQAFAAPPRSRLDLFFSTWLVAALNPKAAVFYVAFLPQFVDPHGEVARQRGPPSTDPGIPRNSAMNLFFRPAGARTAPTRPRRTASSRRPRGSGAGRAARRAASWPRSRTPRTAAC